jgi:hypothetical protein
LVIVGANGYIPQWRIRIAPVFNKKAYCLKVLTASFLFVCNWFSFGKSLRNSCFLQLVVPANIAMKIKIRQFPDLSREAMVFIV